MSIFSRIKDAIFGHKSATTQAQTAPTAQPTGAATAQTPQPEVQTQQPVDVNCSGVVVVPAAVRSRDQPPLPEILVAVTVTDSSSSSLGVPVMSVKAAGYVSELEKCTACAVFTASFVA